MSRSDHEVLKADLKSAASLTASLNNGSGRRAFKISRCEAKRGDRTCEGEEQWRAVFDREQFIGYRVA
jgi:hypothetical protein